LRQFTRLAVKQYLANLISRCFLKLAHVDELSRPASLFLCSACPAFFCNFYSYPVFFFTSFILHGLLFLNEPQACSAFLELALTVSIKNVAIPEGGYGFYTLLAVVIFLL